MTTEDLQKKYQLGKIKNKYNHLMWEDGIVSYCIYCYTVIFQDNMCLNKQTTHMNENIIQLYFVAILVPQNISFGCEF